MRILIAEDDVVLRRLLQNYLEKDGHQIVAAKNGADAWRLFNEEEFPLVLTDWMMPEMDGVDLVRRIRSAGRPGYTYVILVTSRSDKEDIKEGMEAGADDFVTKPFDQDELRIRLRTGERFVQLKQALMKQESDATSNPERSAYHALHEVAESLTNFQRELLSEQEQEQEREREDFFRFNEALSRGFSEAQEIIRQALNRLPP
jgi:DNA-binding response OmpR family regulator